MLDHAAELLVFFVGILYLAVGLYLLQRASNTRAIAELYLGAAFLFNGLSFGLSEIVYVVDAETLIDEFSFAARILSAACAISIAVFTWKVFRTDAKWARRVVGWVAALLVVGLAISAWERDWAGYYPLSYKGFWVEWVGAIAPFVWLAVESIRQYVLARRRVVLGFSDPLICNRYLLIGCYGSLAALTYLIYIPMYIVHELYGTWSPALDLVLGGVEIVSLAALFVSFSAPAFYRRWISGAQTESPPAR